ncbi:gamma-aminobutyric acid receptor subunit beta-like [Galendromus occidentalis]|uniref:Gamma-aminobutyric acid receptor subunit beta n=1 Tax=Galendromus occidentalis TaxID=34638 RepID=A0AAJ7WJ52_9ACAR|nr:gamma-aminobutyric acid receptor subunit beta-like [Galendromus occidentalis]
MDSQVLTAGCVRDVTRLALAILACCILTVDAERVLLHQMASSNNGLRPGQTQRGQNITHILNAFFTKGYDKRVRPNYGGNPVEVGVSMQIVSISTVSEVQMDFTSDFYFRQAWRDERLSFVKSNDLDQMTVGAEVANKIWVPDTFFANEKTAYFHVATTPNTFLRISSEGEVYRSIRLTVTASCPMDLRFFPMDRQSCTIEVESFGYTMSDIRYKWKDGPISIGISKEVELPQFKVLGHVQKISEVSLSTGNYSRLICEVRFVRSMGYYLIQIYIPASLIVVISWVSFWLHRNATPARVSLGVMTVLTMTTLMSSTNSQLPKISYVKSIDVFLGTCFVMVFASLLEYAAVGYLGKRVAMRKSRAQQLAKLAEQARQERARQQAAQEVAHNEPMMPQSPEAMAPLVKGFPGCPTCPTMVQGQPGHVPPCFTMTLYDSQLRRMGEQCCPGIRNCTICSTQQSHQQVQSQAQQQGLQQQQGQPGQQQHSLKKSDSKSSRKESSAQTPEAQTAAGSPAEIEAALAGKNPNKLFGVNPSNIDKYSRVVFPVCFVCFNLTYWVIYLKISDVQYEEPTILH